MPTTWADIQRLAADLQRVQLAEGAKKLSEKNCVEVVSILVASKEIDIIFTTDGREYLTKKHLLTEVKNECIGRGGRVSLSDLAHTLNVDYEHIENAVASIIKQSTSFILCNSELITREYVDSLCAELNERLSEAGVISITQLAKNWDLPTEILNGLVLAEVGTKVSATRDGDKLYTDSYLSAQRNFIKAITNSLTKVTPVSKISSYLGLSSSIFWSLFDELCAAEEIPGLVVGGRTSNLAFYVPSLHVALVKSYVLKTFEEYQILDISTLKKLSVADPSSYLKSLLSKSEFSSLIFFPSAAISMKLWSEIEGSIRDEMHKNCFSDVSGHLPPAICSEQDVEKAVSMCLKSNDNWLSASGQPLLYTQQLLSNAMKALENLINDRAEREAPKWGKLQKTAKKEDRTQEDDWGTGKSKKGKGAKGKNTRQAAKEETSSAALTVRIPHEDLVTELERVGDFPAELLEEIAEQVAASAEAALRSRIETILHSVHTVSAQDQKRSHAQLQEKIRVLYNNFCIFECGASQFDEPISTDLRSHLLRTICTETANTVLSFVSGTENASTLSPKNREETIGAIESEECRKAVSELFSAISNSDLDAFHNAVSRVSSPAVCSLNIKMPDKKQRAELVGAYAAELERQLKECSDAAAGLLMALIILLARRLGIAVHASGKFVSHLIAKVEKSGVNGELSEALTSTQKLVIASLKNKADEDIRSKVLAKLEELKEYILEKE